MKLRVANYGMHVSANSERILRNDYPIEVDIETNTLCTRSCSYCPHDSADNIAMEENIFCSIIDQLKDWNYKGRILPVLFNEPLTDPRIFKFCEYIKQNLPRCYLMIFTNGDLLNLSNINRFVKLQIDEIKISIHEPMDVKVLEKFRQYQELFKCIRIIDMRDGYRMLPLANRGGSINIYNAIQLKKCHLTSSMVIRSDGNVVLCCNDYKSEVVLGNVLNKSLKDIWEDDNYRNLRKEIRNGIYRLNICKSCGYEI